MAGGQGTRLRPLTSNQPKPMLPIVGEPMLLHILRLLRRNDSRFGTVRIADDGGEAMPAPRWLPPTLTPLVGRAGRIRTGDLLTPSQAR